jgi:CHAT domain-containing protein
MAYALPNDYFHSLLLGKNKAAARIINVAAGLASAGGTYSGWTPAFRLPDLHASLDGLAQALRKNDAQAFANHAGNAYIKLVQPVRQHLNRKKELIVSPHGRLGALPFEALVVDHAPEEMEEDKTVKFHRLHYLGADFAVRYVYDLHRLMAAPTRAAGHWVGVAPVFDGGGEADVLDPELRSTLPTELSALAADGRSFVALPFSEGEVNAVATLYGDRAELRLRNQATEEWVKDSAAYYGIVHLATHSFVNGLEPLLSGIALARPTGPAREDGVLYAAEVAALPLRGQLAVLSSCDSGTGPDGGSEGPLSLSRSFLRAGAGGVVCSLWKVYDQHTAALMTGFYQQLGQGLMPAQALRQARARMMRNKRTANPRLWAGFIYIE